MSDTFEIHASNRWQRDAVSLDGRKNDLATELRSVGGKFSDLWTFPPLPAAMKQTTAELIDSLPFFLEMAEANAAQQASHILSYATLLHVFDCSCNFWVCNLLSDELLYQITLLNTPLLTLSVTLGSDALDGRNGEDDSGERLKSDESKIQEPYRSDCTSCD